MTCNILRCEYGCCWIPQRYVLAFMIFVAVMNAYFMRTCLNISLTEMVAAKPDRAGGNQCPGNVSSSVKTVYEKFEWTEEQQQTILGLFFYGYVTTHMPGGFIADKVGGRHVLSQSILISGVLTILTPIITDAGGWRCLAASRFFVGFAQGVLFPAVFTLLSKWVPKRERSIMGSLIFSAGFLGSILGYLGTAALISCFQGWRIVYYVFGTSAVTWYVFFIFMCFSEPTTHPYITSAEAEFLEGEIPKTQKFKVPWLSLLFDPACIAMVIAGIGNDYIFFLFVTELPKYMRDVLKFNIEESGFLNALPYLLLWIGCTLCGYIDTCLINKNILSVANVRKVMSCIGSVIPGVCIVTAGYSGCDRNTASAMLIMGMGFLSPFFAGMRVNILDVTQNFSGILQAYVNGLGALAFAPFPRVISYLAKHNTIEEWRIVFWLVFGLVQATCIVYLIWASGERAEWDKIE